MAIPGRPLHVGCFFFCVPKKSSSICWWCFIQIFLKNQMAVPPYSLVFPFCDDNECDHCWAIWVNFFAPKKILAGVKMGNKRVHQSCDYVIGSSRAISTSTIIILCFLFLWQPPVTSITARGRNIKKKKTSRGGGEGFDQNVPLQTSEMRRRVLVLLLLLLHP